jgi:hypothetical protein
MRWHAGNKRTPTAAGKPNNEMNNFFSFSGKWLRFYTNTIRRVRRRLARQGLHTVKYKEGQKFTFETLFQYLLESGCVAGRRSFRWGTTMPQSRKIN